MTWHLARAAFWSAQIPVAVWASFQPQYQRLLFSYLVVISLMALVESALTDHFTKRRED